MGKKKNKKPREKSEDLARKTVKTGRLPRGARTRFILAMIICTGSASLGNVLLKYGFRKMGGLSFTSLSQIPRTIGAVLGNGILDLGIFLLVVEFAALTYAFRYGPFSLTVPLRGASTYIFTAVLAIFFLGDQVTLWRWVAIATIVSGITLIGISAEES